MKTVVEGGDSGLRQDSKDLALKHRLPVSYFDTQRVPVC